MSIEEGAAAAALPLAGVRVLEVGNGVAAAYCGRLLADLGASVVHMEVRGAPRQQSVGGATELYDAYLRAGKDILVGDAPAVSSASRDADLVLVGEDGAIDAGDIQARVGSVSFSWFGQQGPYSEWLGGELLVQVLTGLPHMVGEPDAPPLQFGERQSTTIAGVTGAIAALSALLAADGRPRAFEVSILEACLALSEMHLYFYERDKLPMARFGLNRFYPNGPVGVYPCKEGWLGITCTTPDQWLALCRVLEMPELAADKDLQTRERRFLRLAEVEARICEALAVRSSAEWAEIGRKNKVPVVVVPDARDILAHPIFRARHAFASFTCAEQRFEVPKSPFPLTGTPLRERLDDGDAVASRSTDSLSTPEVASKRAAPLAGLRVVDFSMGWAGPLATRMLADLGADVLKIEAGRYPDWWRGVNWTEEFVQTRQYETAVHFTGMNRGKRGLSLDLTTPQGRETALQLVARADAVIENQAAGVMAKFGLCYEDLVKVNGELVMASMSAFGLGNAWSSTRAYGSTLEQGSGLPWFVGTEGTAPTMLHLAYGDAVGGLYGCAGTLAALVHRRRGGKGQLLNLSMVETMLQFTTPGLLEYQLTGRAPTRRGNRSARFVPHGIFPVAGHDQWVALFAQDDEAFARLARLLGRGDWVDSGAMATAALRRDREEEIEASIIAWTRTQTRDVLVHKLQQARIAAAPVLHCEELASNPHLNACGYFVERERAYSGVQRQPGPPIVVDGVRHVAAAAAPTLGEHTGVVLRELLGMPQDSFDELVSRGVVTYEPRGVRNANPGQPTESEMNQEMRRSGAMHKER